MPGTSIFAKQFMAKKKKKNSSGGGLLLVIVLLGGFYFWATHWMLNKKQKPAPPVVIHLAPIVPKPDAPVHYPIHGIDVSSYQNDIDWSRLRSTRGRPGVGFVFIKATEGLESRDKLFPQHWKAAGKANIARGAYHFFLSTRDGVSQALNFISLVHLQKGDMPPAVDIEELYGVRPDSMRARLRDFLQTVEDHYQVTPVVYTTATFYNDFLGKGFDRYPLWVASYDSTLQPALRRSWTFWQFNNKGKLPGIGANVDLNAWHSDSASFSSFLQFQSRY